MESKINTELISKSFNFHGQQLMKIWEAEKSHEFAKLNINVKDIPFDVFQQRQKQLSFQDRGMRLKLHHFIVKKASLLFDSAMTEPASTSKEKVTGDEDYYAVMPPYETFITIDKESRTKDFFKNGIKQGDLIIGTIISKYVSGMMIKVLCTEGQCSKYVEDLNIKAFCPTAYIIAAVDKKGINRNYLINDTVCCEVVEVMAETEKLVCGMNGSTVDPDSENANRLGLINREDFPESFRKTQDLNGENYEKVLERSLGFYNPNNINYLSSQLGIGNNYLSNMNGMRGRFPEQEYSNELRQQQASKWAFRSVAEGIEHFKSGRHSEAFQCLNKALNIDPRNVEGLVARGALYANSGSFQKAIEDFENSLKLNPNHQNARKYMGETLVALGRSYEDENKFEEALKAYENCLTLIPFHEEAQNSIEFLKNKLLNSSKLGDTSDMLLPGLSSSKSLEMKETLKQLLKNNEEEEKKGDKKERKSKKKKDRKSRKRRHRSSSSSSTSSSGSSRSSSSSSSSSSESSSGASSRSGSSRSPSRKSRKRRKRNKKEDKREKSLSPLSKRMALMEPSPVADGLTGLLAQRLSHYNPPAMPHSFAASSFKPVPEQKSYEKDDYEQRVCRFLEQTKGDSEYEEKVRKFLEETAKWKKERKAQDEKSKKKKKKEKKAKDKSKKKKRDKDDHEKKKKHRSKRDKLESKDLDETMDPKKFREAFRNDLSSKENLRKRKGFEDEEDFMYGGNQEKKELRLLGLENLPDLEDLESKLSAYYAQVEKDTGLSKGSTLEKMDESRNEEKPEKKMRHSLSPSSKIKPQNIPSPKGLYLHHEEKNERIERNERELKKSIPSEPVPSLSKWKMHIPPMVTSTKVKKKEKEKEPWEEVEEKRSYLFMKNEKEEEESRRKKLPDIRKTELPPKQSELALIPEEKINAMDKFQGGFRINQNVIKKASDDSNTIAAKTNFLPKGPRTDSESGSDAEIKRKRKQIRKRGPGSGGESSRSRSHSRNKGSRAGSSHSSRSRRSRSKSGSYIRRRSHSGSYTRYDSRSRSRSYERYSRSGSRSRSRSYRSRSRSYSRSRSRSRSFSGDRHRRYDHHMKYRGRYQGNRGTYYRPRFQNFKNFRGGGGGGGGYPPRGGRDGYHPKYIQGGRGRPYPKRGRGRGRGRFFHYKPGYHRRYESSRPRSRDSEDRRSYSRDDDDPMRKVDAVKEKINKYIEEEDKKEHGSGERDSRGKHEPLSEGEAPDDDDYPPLPPNGSGTSGGGGGNGSNAAGSSSGYVDRKVYDGEGGSGGGGGGSNSGTGADGSSGSGLVNSKSSSSSHPVVNKAPGPPPPPPPMSSAPSRSHTMDDDDDDDDEEDEDMGSPIAPPGVDD